MLPWWKGHSNAPVLKLHPITSCIYCEYKFMTPTWHSCINLQAVHSGWSHQLVYTIHMKWLMLTVWKHGTTMNSCDWNSNDSPKRLRTYQALRKVCEIILENMISVVDYRPVNWQWNFWKEFTTLSRQHKVSFTTVNIYLFIKS